MLCPETLLGYAEVEDDDRPSSLRECFTSEGTINAKLCLEHIAKQEELEEIEDELLFPSSDVEDEDSSRPAKPRAKRKFKSLAPYYFNDNGEAVFLKPRQSIWHWLHVRSPTLDSPKFVKKFRRRFRMTYSQHQQLLEKVKIDDCFRRWSAGAKDAVGKKASPIELLLLGSLRCLGRGLTFDDLEECTAIGEETHRQFLHVFIGYGSNTLCPIYVKMPTNNDDFATHRKEFDIGGLTGAGFSTDATT